ncbi:flagellar hook-length control protein FliK [Neomoorella carbonis]|uniref:flagellar hook-length control protein FliK n=1 Tax=Neomoorella carbonis TaxID=3062783 RepID=UPI0032464264
MTVHAVTRTAGREVPVRERDWRSEAGSDFTLYLAGLLQRPGLTQSAGRQELSGQDEGRQETAAREKADAVRPGDTGRGMAVAGPEDRAGRQVRETGPEAAGEDRTPPGLKSRRQGEKQVAAAKQDEIPAGQPGAKKAAGGPGASGESGAGAGKAAATVEAGNSNRNNMPAVAGVPAEAVNPLSQEEPDTLLSARKTAGLDAVAGRLSAAAGTAAQGKKTAAVAAGEGPGVLTAAGTAGAAGEVASLSPEGVLTAGAAGVPDFGLETEPAPGLKVAGSKGGFRQGVPEVQGQAKNGGELFARAGDRAWDPGARQEAFPVREGALTRTAGGSQAESITARNILNSTEPGPGMNHTGGQREPGTAGGAGITGNDSLLAGQGSFPTVFPGTDRQAGGVVLPVSNLPEVMAAIMASARMSRSGSQQELEIQLQPERLGNMKLKATLEGSRLVLHLLVENSEAARALQAAVPEMRQVVAEQGLRLDQVQVQVAGGGRGNGYQTGDGGEHRQRPAWQRGAAWSASEEETVTFGNWYRLDYLA